MGCGASMPGPMAEGMAAMKKDASDMQLGMSLKNKFLGACRRRVVRSAALSSDP